MTWGLEKEIDEISESLSAKMEGSAQKKKKTKKKTYIDESMSTGANWRSSQCLKWNNYRKNKVV